MASVVQVLLAIAAGAVLVTPEWLTASVEAGEWLPEEPFLAQVCGLSCIPHSFMHTCRHGQNDAGPSVSGCV